MMFRRPPGRLHRSAWDCGHVIHAAFDAHGGFTITVPGPVNRQDVVHMLRRAAERIVQEEITFTRRVDPHEPGVQGAT